MDTIADVEKRLGNSGRLVIRPSGTEPVIRVMAEAETDEIVNAVVNEICDAVKAAA
jgi:phosphoglucosamine mutase